jgi:hypothetical protein
VPSDFIFVALVAAVGVALVADQLRLRFHRAFWLVGAYFAALAVSALFSADVTRSASKMLTQVYLLSVPFLLFWLVRSEEDLRRVALASPIRWLDEASAWMRSAFFTKIRQAILST